MPRDKLNTLSYLRIFLGSENDDKSCHEIKKWFELERRPIISYVHILEKHCFKRIFKKMLCSFSQRRASSSFSSLVSRPQTPTTLASRKRLGVKGCRVSPLRLGVELVTSIVMWSNSRARTSSRLDAHMMYMYDHDVVVPAPSCRGRRAVTPSPEGLTLPLRPFVWGRVRLALVYCSPYDVLFLEIGSAFQEYALRKQY